MTDPSMMLHDLEGFRNSTRRPWLAIVIIVVLATSGAIWLVKRFDRQLPPPPAGDVDEPRQKQGRKARRQPAAPAVKESATPQLSAAAAELFAAARTAEAGDRLLEARTNYLALLESKESTADTRSQVETRLAALNITLVTTQHEMPEKVDYAIRSGDSLKLLARRFNTPLELIVRANRIQNPDRIQIGDRLRILNKPRFEITVSKSANDLLVTLNGTFFKRYRVGTGLYGRTPVGSFIIKDKLENPPWWRPDGGMIPFGNPENILGTRWMALAATGDTPPARGYGIHGTWDNSTLGQQSSAGCVRMANSDVEELFMLIPDNTPVTIVD